MLPGRMHFIGFGMQRGNGGLSLALSFCLFFLFGLCIGRMGRRNPRSHLHLTASIWRHGLHVPIPVRARLPVFRLVELETMI